MSQEIRHTAVAGMFYPANPSELQNTVTQYLQETQTEYCAEPSSIRAIIVPHAGYIYSGPIAASAYSCILPLREKIRRIILLGPSHRVAFKGISATRASYYETPLGNIKLDTETTAKLVESQHVQYIDAAHKDEHCLEVQLPFLQTVVDNFTLIPLVVGDASPAEIAAVLSYLDNDEHTLIVISSDLSHYHQYQDAQQRDMRTSDAIENLQPERIDFDDACGRNPVNGLLTLAKQNHWHCKNIDLRNSGDTAGDKQRVVGYGAYIVTDHAQ